MGGLKVGEIIRELRGRNGISQETLADVCGISMQAVSKWENGQCYPDITFLPVLAEYFQVSTDYLLMGRRNEGAADETVREEENRRIADMLKDETKENILYILQYWNGKIIGRENRGRGGTGNEEAVRIAFDEEFRELKKGLKVEIWGSAEIVADGIVADIEAGGNVNCGDVEGDIKAGGSVCCTGIAGDVRAGSDVDCSDIGGDATAGCSIKCRDIAGDAKAGVSITCQAVRGEMAGGADGKS